MSDPFESPTPGTHMACERCGKPTVILRLGESAPTVCEVCAEYERRKQEARTLAGSPSEMAAKKNLKLEVNWRA